ncbi:MAG: hypothetical protein R2942_12510 [Ignavibacteria bacterium]
MSRHQNLHFEKVSLSDSIALAENMKKFGKRLLQKSEESENAVDGNDLSE